MEERNVDSDNDTKNDLIEVNLEDSLVDSSLQIFLNSLNHFCSKFEYIT